MTTPQRRTLEVTEQRTQSISAELYRELGAAQSIQELIETGVISLVRSRTNPYAVRAGPYVGQALISEGHRLVVREKSGGALQKLLHWSVPEEWREAEVPGTVARSHGGPVLETFARRFLAHLAEYLRDGRLKEYRAEHLDVGSPRGRIDLVGTARLRSKGAAGRVAYWRPRLTADVLPNRLLALALSSVDAYFRLEARFADVLDLARYYAPVFADVDHLHYDRRDWTLRAEAFAAVFADTRVGGELRRALMYARALVLHLGPWYEEEWDEGPPNSFFLNLQTLFEDAVRQVTADTALERVSKGAALERPLLAEIADRYIVDPDMVVGDYPAVGLVADCKYKDFGGQPDHADVYQLVAHATALNCATAVLIYPGAEAAVEVLGRANPGVEIRWATVRLDKLQDDIREVLNCCGVPVHPEQAGA